MNLYLSKQSENGLTTSVRFNFDENIITKVQIDCNSRDTFIDHEQFPSDIHSIINSFIIDGLKVSEESVFAIQMNTAIGLIWEK